VVVPSLFVSMCAVDVGVLCKFRVVCLTSTYVTASADENGVTARVMGSLLLCRQPIKTVSVCNQDAAHSLCHVCAFRNYL
jgi:hypothetical protein